MVHKLWLFLALIFCLSGCWDQEEVSKRALVLAMGLDQAAEGKIKVSLQIPIVEELLIVPSGAAVSAKPFALVSAEGSSAFATVPGLNAKTQTSLFFGQIQTVFINTELARKGLTGPTDFLRRHPTVPPQAFLLLTERPAHEMLEVRLISKRIPSYSTVTFFHSNNKKDQVFPQRIWEFNRNIRSQTQDAFIPLIEYDTKEETFIIKGLGVFDGDRLAGILSGEETRMVGLLTGKTRNAYLSIPTERFGRITFRKVTAAPRTKIEHNGHQLLFRFHVNAQGFLVESTRGITRFTPEDLEWIQTETALYLNREIKKAVQRLQALNSDILALGEKYRAHYPRKWDPANWKLLYSEAKIEVSVKFTVTRNGTML